MKGRQRNPQATIKAATIMQGRPQNKPLTAAATTHWRARHVVLRAPNRRIYIVSNIRHFVRSESHLFNSSDLTEYTCGGKTRNKASNGLQSLTKIVQRQGSWKGWTLVEDLDAPNITETQITC
jgi:hypothetical protein